MRGDVTIQLSCLMTHSKNDNEDCKPETRFWGATLVQQWSHVESQV